MYCETFVKITFEVAMHVSEAHFNLVTKCCAFYVILPLYVLTWKFTMYLRILLKIPFADLVGLAVVEGWSRRDEQYFI